MEKSKALELEEPNLQGGSEVPAAAVREELKRIVSSRAFQATDRQKSFLRYVVEETLNGRGGQLKEYPIGLEVFGKPESFDPRVDTIVRAQARKLRMRLAEYYASEGSLDTFRIEFLKGSYAPIFRAVSQLSGNEAIAPNTVSAPNGEFAARVVSTVAAENRPARALTASYRSLIWVAVLLVAVAIAYGVFVRQRDGGAANEGPSLVVLPFLNLSESQEEDFFSDGLTEELIDSLTRIPNLRVVARSSAFQYRGKTLDVRRVGRELNVRTVLEGSVRKSGDHLRITAQLEDAINGYHIWSASYDREVNDTLAIQREISQAITQALGIQLLSSGGFKSDPARSAPVNADAHQYYLKGLYYRRLKTPEDLKAAISYFEKAIAADSNYALAYAGLAQCYVELPITSPVASSEVIPKIKKTASKALQLDKSLGEAHMSLGMAYAYALNWGDGEKEFQKALELNPGNADVHQWHGNFLLRMGRPVESLAANRTAWDLDPVSMGALHSVARSLYHLRRFDEAGQQFLKALEMGPNAGIVHQGLGLAYLAQKKYALGLAETETARRLIGADTWTTGQLGYAYAVSGDHASAQRILNELLSSTPPETVRALPIARIYIGQGDRDKAFEWLRKAVAQQDVNLLLKADPLYDPLRSDPRFTDLLRQMRLD